ncbi:TetR/AcrR family transcriptional regulator [Croceiramulus getboli]|nr:TetR/AcrR family transcriptional regulator [Flavobacteriaceae bacterium YJPT1-3]
MDLLPVTITMDERLYAKNPESSDLGRRIVSESIVMIDELGFEGFTFKKLGNRIGSNESSIYRYFKSKHQLLLYLICWYWSWLEYRVVFSTNSLPTPEQQLKQALHILTQQIDQDQDFSYIDEALLSKIIVAEGAKAYHTKAVDRENEKGFFKVYKRLVHRLSSMVLAIQPDYPYPHMLISTAIEGAHQQRYFAQHLPALTDVAPHQDNIQLFYTDLVLNAIQ